MKLEINYEDIQAAVQPYNFSMIDIVGLNPRIAIGAFEGCSLNLICNKVLVITDGIILVYNKWEDFLNGFEPVSLVKSSSIKYSQDMHGFNFVIHPAKTTTPSIEDFEPIRELMFGAREISDPDQEMVEPPLDEALE